MTQIKKKGPAKMPNGVLISQVMLEANYLKEVAEEYRKYRPSVTVVANVKNGIIEDRKSVV